jgi:hypothetical protein
MDNRPSVAKPGQPVRFCKVSPAAIINSWQRLGLVNERLSERDKVSAMSQVGAIGPAKVNPKKSGTQRKPALPEAVTAEVLIVTMAT